MLYRCWGLRVNCWTASSHCIFPHIIHSRSAQWPELRAPQPVIKSWLYLRHQFMIQHFHGLQGAENATMSERAALLVQLKRDLNFERHTRDLA